MLGHCRWFHVSLILFLTHQLLRLGESRTVVGLPPCSPSAAGAWLGERFLATEEAHIHRLYRQRILEADETETVYSTLFDKGWPDVPHRVIENTTVSDWNAAGQPRVSDRGRARSSRKPTMAHLFGGMKIRLQFPE